MHRIDLLLALTLSLPFHPSRPARPAPAPIGAARAVVPRQGYEQARTAAVRERISDLASLARYCERKHWYLERDRLLALVLELDPDHAATRKGLGYKRSGGAWVRETAPQSFNEAYVDQEDLEERETKAREDDLRRRLEALDEFAAELAAAEVEGELRALLALHPQAPEVRKRLGYVPGWEGHPWVTSEAKASMDRRLSWQAKARELRERAPAAKAVGITPAEQKLGVPWTAALRNPIARAVTSFDAEEATNALQVAWAAGELVKAELGVEPNWPERLAIHILAPGAQVEALARSWPETTEDRALLVRVNSSWLDWENLGVWNPSAPARLDSVTRQLVGRLLRRFGVTPDQGWIWEGFGVYLSHSLIGTRLVFFTQPSEYVERGQTLRQLLEQKDADWYGLARRVLSSPKPPGLVFLLGKDVNRLTDEDLLVAHALAAYVLEAHAEKAAELLRRIGAQEPPAKVLEEVLGIPIAELAPRLSSWLAEIT